MNGLPNAVVLQTAIDVIRLLSVGIDRIKLTHRGLICFNPILTTIITNVDPAVVPIHKVLWVFRVDPQGVVVGMYIGRI